MPPLMLADLGGVVVKIDPARCHAAWAGLSRLTPAEVAERVFPDALYEALERGEVTGDDYLKHVQQELRSDADVDVLAACFNDIYLGIDQHVLDVLGEHKAAGARLAALTNTNQRHHDHWSSMYHEHLDLFDRIYLSHELGARKPEVACFQAVLSSEGVAPDQVVFIDDVEQHVEAARSLGIIGVHFTTAQQLAKDLQRLGT